MLPPGYERALLESWEFFVHLAVVLVPLFVVASFLVALAQEYLPPERVEGRLREYDEGVGNVVAAVFGGITPFCSCSTVPALAGLLQAGAPLGLAFSFLLASPLVNEIAVVLLLGWFGVDVTVLYVLATLTAAIVGGIAIGRLGLSQYVKDLHLATDGGTATRGPDGPVPVERTHPERFRVAARGACSFFSDTVPYLLLGMTVGALVHGVVPVEVVRAVLGPANPVAVPLAALAGAPIYVSMSGMLPIAAVLHGKGVAIGTVLAFVVGGAGVSIPNLVLLNRLFERRLLVVYAGTIVAIGTVVGVLFNLVLL